uniref:Uncharacterized protein n=1 Tax=Pseudictyota dubia TaxID=2749911 RepID=A0A7R9W2U0_9STRA|mmetsp:Transcript_31007/g.57313  ORF Transcript_31007/g.57313 Transcript_31007/m.57313 type:complete len:242 (+) Transcript_31007:219-944(+)
MEEMRVIAKWINLLDGKKSWDEVKVIAEDIFHPDYALIKDGGRVPFARVMASVEKMLTAGVSARLVKVRKVDEGIEGTWDSVYPDGRVVRLMSVWTFEDGRVIRSSHKRRHSKSFSSPNMSSRTSWSSIGSADDLPSVSKPNDEMETDTTDNVSSSSEDTTLSSLSEGEDRGLEEKVSDNKDRKDEGNKEGDDGASMGSNKSKKGVLRRSLKRVSSSNRLKALQTRRKKSITPSAQTDVRN